jgi:hypothetical protein
METVMTPVLRGVLYGLAVGVSIALLIDCFSEHRVTVTIVCVDEPVRVQTVLEKVRRVGK